MKQIIETIEINSHGKMLKEITSEVESIIQVSKIENGLINLSILHTTASLVIQENADPDVLKDLENYFEKMVPISSEYKHSIEGSDDMPAHIKSSITNSNLTLSIINKKLKLGRWQGIFLFEHRVARRERTIQVHILGQ